MAEATTNSEPTRIPKDQGLKCGFLQNREFIMVNLVPYQGESLIKHGVLKKRLSY